MGIQLKKNSSSQARKSSSSQLKRLKAQKSRLRRGTESYVVSAANPSPWSGSTQTIDNDTKFGCVELNDESYFFRQQVPHVGNLTYQDTQLQVPSFAGFVQAAFDRSNNTNACGVYTPEEGLAWPNTTCAETSRSANIPLLSGSLYTSEVEGKTPLAGCLTAVAGGYPFVLMPEIVAKASSSSLSGLQVAAIVVSVVVSASLLGAAGFYYFKGNKRENQDFHELDNV